MNGDTNYCNAAGSCKESAISAKSKKKARNKSSSKQNLSNPSLLTKSKASSRRKDGLRKLSLEQLVDAAKDHIESSDIKSAKICMDFAMKKFNPQTLEFLKFASGFYLECQDYEVARKLLEQQIKLGDSSHVPYFSLGQLSEGTVALALYLKGIELLEKDIINKGVCTSRENGVSNGSQENLLVDDAMNSNSAKVASESTKTDRCSDGDDSDKEDSGASHTIANEIQKLKRTVAAGYCSVSELYTTDLCDEDDAEEKCVDYLQKALAAAETPDGYLCKANYLLIKSELEEAREMVLKSVNLWLPQYRQLEEGESDSSQVDPESIPSSSVRLQSAKLLIEVGEMDLSNELLEGLMGEDDESVDIWYLMGWNLYINGEERHKPESKYHLKRALELHTKLEDADVDKADHIKELLSEMEEVETDSGELDSGEESVEEMEVDIEEGES